MFTLSHFRVFLLTLVMAISFSHAQSAHAEYPIEKIPGGDQAFGDFVVGPVKVDLTIPAGESRNVELMVTNRMGERREFNLGVEDAKGSDDPQTPVVLLGDDRGPYSLRDYIHFPEASFPLGQGERARIPVTISIPSDAQPGGLYGSVLVTTHTLPDPTATSSQSGSAAASVIVSRIAVLFFITVPGDVKHEGHLSKFVTLPEGKKIYNQGPVDFQILFQNTGSVHLSPQGTISIKNMFGQEVGSVTSDPWYAFPNSIRMRQLTWNREHLFGRYTATLTLERGYEDQTDTAVVTFYVIPWQLIAEVFVGLIVLFFILRFVVRSFEIKRR